MKMDKPTIIGFKYVGAGLLAFAICLLIITKLIGYNSSGTIGSDVGIMSAMVMTAAREAYRVGR